MRIVHKIIKIERSISRSKGKKEIETITLFMERNTRRSENDRDSLTFRGGYGYRSYRAVFSTDIGTVVPRKTRNDDPLNLLLVRPFYTSVRFVSFFFPFLFFSSRQHRSKKTTRKFRDRFESIRFMDEYMCKMKYISRY